MRCIYCNSNDTRVIDSRVVEDGYAIRRRRECLICKKRMTTYEKIEERNIVVVKKSGQRDIFSRDKLYNGILKSCFKTKVCTEEVESIVFEVEKTLRDQNLPAVESSRIGELVMELLKKIDPVAYVRFASVYREFKDVETFLREVEEIIRKK